MFLQPKEVSKHQGDNDVNTDDTPFLNSDQVAFFLGPSYRTLNRYRLKNDGPVFHPFRHRAPYRGADFEAWSAEQRITPTSNDGSNWRTCPNAGGEGTGSAADPSLGSVAPAAKEMDASNG